MKAAAFSLKTEKLILATFSGSSPLLMGGMSPERIETELLRKKKPLFSGRLPQKICEFRLFRLCEEYFDQNAPEQGLLAQDEEGLEAFHREMLEHLRKRNLTASTKTVDVKLKQQVKLLVRGAEPDTVDLKGKQMKLALLYLSVRQFMLNQYEGEELDEERKMRIWLYQRARDEIQGGVLQERADLPRKICEASLYTDPEGRLCIPSSNLFACLVQAGEMVKNGKMFISGKSGTSLNQHLSIFAEHLQLTDLNPEQPWVIDRRKGPKSKDGRRCDIIRPRFDSWGFQAELLLDLAEISEKTLRLLFELAGQYVGLGAFRPGLDKKAFARLKPSSRRRTSNEDQYTIGNFGRFRVTGWKEIKPK